MPKQSLGRSLSPQSWYHVGKQYPAKPLEIRATRAGYFPYTAQDQTGMDLCFIPSHQDISVQTS